MLPLLHSAFQNIRKDKASSAFNVIGLTLILTLGLFLLFNILYEAGYDQHHEKADRLYRVASVIRNGQEEYSWNVSQASLAPELLTRHSEVVNATRFWSVGKTRFFAGTKQAEENEFYFADPGVFDMFTYPFLIGSPQSSLIEPRSIVLTKSVALKYFNSVEDAFSKKLVNERGESFTVTGVMADLPGNSHFTFDALISSATGYGLNSGWGNFSAHTYIEIGQHCTHKQIAALLDRIADEKMAGLTDEFDVRVTYQLQRLPDIHKTSIWKGNQCESGNYEAIVILGSAVLLIIFAIVMLLVKKNDAEKRFLLEAELRRKISTHRVRVILQSAAESICITMIALILGACLLAAVLPLANELIRKTIPVSYLWHPVVTLFILCVLIFSGLVGAIYPAFYLPDAKPSRAFNMKRIKEEGMFMV